VFFYEFLAIDLDRFRVESCNFLHEGKLNQHKTSTKNIRFINIVLSKSRIAIYDMSLPQYRW